MPGVRSSLTKKQLESDFQDWLDSRKEDWQLDAKVKWILETNPTRVSAQNLSVVKRVQRKIDNKKPVNTFDRLQIEYVYEFLVGHMEDAEYLRDIIHKYVSCSILRKQEESS